MIRQDRHPYLEDIRGHLKARIETKKKTHQAQLGSPSCNGWHNGWQQAPNMAKIKSQKRLANGQKITEAVEIV